jgi:hypothetical protein
VTSPFVFLPVLVQIMVKKIHKPKFCISKYLVGQTWVEIKHT